MALFLFTKVMLAGEPSQVFNEGRMVRDSTYFVHITVSLLRVLDKLASPDPAFNPAASDPASSWAPHSIFKIGNSTPTPLIDYSAALEAWTGFKPNTPHPQPWHIVHCKQDPTLSDLPPVGLCSLSEPFDARAPRARGCLPKARHIPRPWSEALVLTEICGFPHTISRAGLRLRARFRGILRKRSGYSSPLALRGRAGVSKVTSC